MRSLLVLGLVATGILVSGCVQNSYRSRPYQSATTVAPSAASTAAATAAVVRSDPTEVTYVSKPAPEGRKAYPAPPPPSLPDGISAADVAGTPCAPAPACDPCKPRNPFARLFCNPCCGPGG